MEKTGQLPSFINYTIISSPSKRNMKCREGVHGEEEVLRVAGVGGEEGEGQWVRVEWRLVKRQKSSSRRKRREQTSGKRSAPLCSFTNLLCKIIFFASKDDFPVLQASFFVEIFGILSLFVFILSSL